MISSNDRDLLSMFSGHTYVFFRQDEDTFFVISFDQPSADMFALTQVPGKSKTMGVVRYHRFKNSASDDFRVVTGVWEKTAIGDGKHIRFTPSSGGKAHASAEPTTAAVDENEIRIGYSFQNREKAEVDYNLQLLRSNLGFVENYEWADPKTNKHNHNTYPGDCGEFN